MNPRALAIVALCLASPGGFALAQNAQAPAPVASGDVVIRGIVVNAASDAPLPRVTVSAAVPGQSPRRVTTGSDGTFALSLATPKEPVRLQAYKAGFVRAVVDLPVPVRPGVVTDIRVAMVRGAAISGRIIDASGGVPESAAAVGVGVTAGELVPVLQRVAADGTMTRASAATTRMPNLMDPEGRYRFGGLAAGRYALSAELRPPNSSASPMMPVIVEVAAGQELGGVDLQVETTPPAPMMTAPREGDGTIRGRVSGLDGQPLEGATVLAIRERQVRTARTDTGGRFVFEGLRTGTFAISAAKLGYTSWPGRQEGMPSLTVALAAGEQRDDIELALARTGTISGTVVDEHGDPLQGALLRVIPASQTGNNLTRVADPDSSSLTDDRGEFRLAGLRPGAYVVSAFGPGTFGFGSSADADVVYAPIYYPGVRDRVSAAHITIAPAEHVNTIALTLRSIPVGRISGIAFDSSGLPARGAVRLLAPDDSGEVFEPRTATAGPTGEFAFTDVPHGTYLMEMSTTRSSGRELGTIQVTLTDVEQPPVVLRTRPGATITGRLVLEGPGQIEGYSMTARRLVGGSSRTSGSRTLSGPVVNGGSFTMNELWGTTRVQVTSLDEKWYLKSIMINGIDAADYPFDFGGDGRRFDDVEVVFASKPASIAGRVVDQRGGGAVAASVLVFAVDSTRWFAGSRWLKSTASNADGVFAIKGLPPGDYYAVAVEGLDRAARENPSGFLHELMGAATRLPAAAGAERTTTLRVTRLR